MPRIDKKEKAEYMRKYHQRRKDDPVYQENRRRSQRKRVQKMRQWCRDYKAERGCARCPERDSRCLVFHHLRDKKFDIGASIDRHCGWKHLKAEIEKCEVLCANCHAKEHISD